MNSKSTTMSSSFQPAGPAIGLDQSSISARCAAHVQAGSGLPLIRLPMLCIQMTAGAADLQPRTSVSASAPHSTINSKKPLAARSFDEQPISCPWDRSHGWFRQASVARMPRSARSGHRLPATLPPPLGNRAHRRLLLVALDLSRSRSHGGIRRRRRRRRPGLAAPPNSNEQAGGREGEQTSPTSDHRPGRAHGSARTRLRRARAGLAPHPSRHQVIPFTTLAWARQYSSRGRSRRFAAGSPPRTGRTQNRRYLGRRR